jgi:hypothetical protein
MLVPLGYERYVNIAIHVIDHNTADISSCRTLYKLNKTYLKAIVELSFLREKIHRKIQEEVVGINCGV